MAQESNASKAEPNSSVPAESTGAEREQRDDMLRRYEQIIMEADRAQGLPGRDVGKIWNDIRHRWQDQRPLKPEGFTFHLHPAQGCPSRHQAKLCPQPVEADMRAFVRYSGFDPLRTSGVQCNRLSGWRTR
jgi:hypothetical protein